MDWVSASNPPVAPWEGFWTVDHPSLAFGTLAPLDTFPTHSSHALSYYNSVEPFKIPGKPASFQAMADCPESFTLKDFHKYDDFEISGLCSPPRAPSVGSGHLSIGSAGSSNHSWSSWRGRSRIKKVFSRGSSIAGRAKSTMKAGMSSWSLDSAKKHVSPSPRRTGKLTDVARAGMRLLKGQGACWKCKILKKTVRKVPLSSLPLC